MSENKAPAQNLSNSHESMSTEARIMSTDTSPPKNTMVSEGATIPEDTPLRGRIEDPQKIETDNAATSELTITTEPDRADLSHREQIHHLESELFAHSPQVLGFAFRNLDPFREVIWRTNKVVRVPIESITNYMNVHRDFCCSVMLSIAAEKAVKDLGDEVPPDHFLHGHIISMLCTQWMELLMITIKHWFKFEKETKDLIKVLNLLPEALQDEDCTKYCSLIVNGFCDNDIKISLLYCRIRGLLLKQFRGPNQALISLLHKFKGRNKAMHELNSAYDLSLAKKRELKIERGVLPNSEFEQLMRRRCPISDTLHEESEDPVVPSRVETDAGACHARLWLESGPQIESMDVFDDEPAGNAAEPLMAILRSDYRGE